MHGSLVIEPCFWYSYIKIRISFTCSHFTSKPFFTVESKLTILWFSFKRTVSRELTLVYSKLINTRTFLVTLAFLETHVFLVVI